MKKGIALLRKRKKQDIQFEQKIISKMHEQKAPIDLKNKSKKEKTHHRSFSPPWIHRINNWLSIHVPFMQRIQNSMIFPIFEQNQQAKDHWLASLNNVKRLFISANDPKHYQPKRIILRFSKPMSYHNQHDETMALSFKQKPKFH